MANNIPIRDSGGTSRLISSKPGQVVGEVEQIQGIEGLTVVGSVPTGNPVQIAALGTDGNLYPLKQSIDGTLMVNPAGGSIIAVVGNPTLTASTDTLYTFASKVRHILIQNNTGTDAAIEFDAIATLGSYRVFAGQERSLDISCTVLHIFSTAASPINGATSLNIVLKGWS